MKNMILPLCLIAAGTVLLCSISGQESVQIPHGTPSAETTVPVLTVSGSLSANTIRVLLKNENSIYHDKPLENEYPGKLDCYETSEGYVYVNEVTLNDYLAGVLFQEMPSSFGDEALKAQAVCARSYALSHMESYAYPEYRANLDNTVSFQVYNGTVSERAKSLVEATGNAVITFKEAIVNAYFFSTSCGVTGDGRVWQKDVPYLTSVPVARSTDLADGLEQEEKFRKLLRNKEAFYEKDSPWFRWSVKYNCNCLLNQLQAKYGHEAKRIVSVNVGNRLSYGLVDILVIETDQGTVRVEGQNEIRELFEDSEVFCHDGSRQTLSMLPSAFFVVAKEGNSLVIDGGGFGHGAGMSQYGAEALAGVGYTWDEIIRFFFPMCELRQLEGGEE